MNLSSLDSDLGLLVMRLTVGALMLFHGVAKIMHPGSLDFISTMLTGNGLPAVLAYGVYLGEVIAPLMVIAGFRARIGAMIMAVNMLFAIFLAHADDIFSLTSHGGWMIELQMFYLMGAIAVVFTGSGKYAFQAD
jgi:putative oxidoreductase